MISFKNYSELKEGRYPTWLKFVTGGIVLKVKGLSNQIQNETDPKKQNALIAQQNNLLSYIVGLGIGISSKDNKLLNKLKNSMKPKT